MQIAASTLTYDYHNDMHIYTFFNYYHLNK